MNVLIITFGTRGDVQPYVALGRGLQSAGHTVTICTSLKFEAFVREHGLGYGHMTDDLHKLFDSGAGRDAMEDTTGLLGVIKTSIKLMKVAKPINRQMSIDSWGAAQAADPDLILFHPKSLVAPSIAEKLGVPAMMALLQPMIVPSGEAPVMGFPDLNAGRWYNRLTYRLVHMGFGMYRGMVNEFRRDTLGLGKLPRAAGVLRMADGQPIPVLHGVSEHVFPRPHDWPDTAHITGYWFLDRPNEWEPSPELQNFLDAGEPPVYAGFGSMAGRNPQRLAHIVVDALQRANVRGIVATGWGGLEAGDLPETILSIDEAPHDWLFSRVSAVVHHGGAGTTAAGLRAGRATMICPFMGDQPFWGQRVRALGVGPEPVPQKKLTAEKLANAIRAATGNTAMRAKAESLGALIRREDGVATAVGIVERVLQEG